MDPVDPGIHGSMDPNQIIHPGLQYVPGTAVLAVEASIRQTSETTTLVKKPLCFASNNPFYFIFLPES